MSLSQVIARFDHPSAAQDAVTALVDAGFQREAISLLPTASEDVLRARRNLPVDATHRAIVPPDTGAAMGFALGFLGGGFGGLILGTGALPIMGMGPAMSIGPFWSAAVGAMVLGFAGAIAGYIFNAPLPRLEPQGFDPNARGPAIGTILSVLSPEDRVQDARSVLGRLAPDSVKVWSVVDASWQAA